MSALEEWLMLLLLEHNVNMLRVEAEAKSRVLALLILMQKDIVSILANAPAMSELGKLGKNTIIRESNAVIAEYYGKAALQVDLFGIAEVESMGVKRALATVLERAAGPASVEIRIGLSLPTENYLQKLASDVLIQGSPAKNWWLRQTQDVQFKLANEIRIGAAQGETNAQIIKRIVGQDATVAKAPAAPGAVPAIEPSIPGVMPLARKNAAAIVQTSMATVAAEARRATFKANADITNGIMQVSTLDSHVSAICIAYSGATWDNDYEPSGDNDLPYNGGVPRHFNAVAAGEMVSTATGPKPIEMVAVGEMVLTHRGRYRPVTAVMCKRNDASVIRVISLESGRTIRVTDEHPVLAADRGWLRADTIEIGDKLFQHQDQAMPVHVGLGIDKSQPNDYPSVGHAGEVFRRVSIEPGAVAMSLSVKFDDDFGVKKGEVSNTVMDDELRRVCDSKRAQAVCEQHLAKREVGKLKPLNLLANACDGARQRCGVVLRHALGMVRVIGVSLFGKPPCPMILAGHFPGALRFCHGDAGSDATLTNRDSVAPAPAIKDGLAEPMLALDLANGLDHSEVFGVDQVGDGLLVSEVNHFNSYSVNDIRTVAHNEKVYNLAVQDDETYLIDGVVVHNCRSSEIAIMKTLREMGIDMDEPDPGMRASSEGPISAKTTMAEFMKMKGADYQNETLGPGRAELFRSGKMSTSDLVSALGKPLKLSDLRAKYQ